MLEPYSVASSQSFLTYKNGGLIDFQCNVFPVNLFFFFFTFCLFVKGYRERRKRTDRGKTYETRKGKVGGYEAKSFEAMCIF
jgi:hypothetical protein